MQPINIGWGGGVGAIKLEDQVAADMNKRF